MRTLEGYFIHLEPIFDMLLTLWLELYEIFKKNKSGALSQDYIQFQPTILHVTFNSL